MFWGSGAVFCGRFWSGGEVRMGGFAAEFRGGLGGVRVRRGDSAHGGQCRARGAKKFLKIFKKGVKTRKLGCERC